MLDNGGVLTPAAGRATQQLPGPRVVDGILPAGRVLLVRGFVLGARHGDWIGGGAWFFYLFIFFNQDLPKNSRRLLFSPP